MSGESWREAKLKMVFNDDHEKTFTVFRVEVNQASISKLRGSEIIHIPRSLVTYRRRYTHDGLRIVEFTLPQWKVEQEDLEGFEID